MGKHTTFHLVLLRQWLTDTTTQDPPPGIEKDPAIDKLDELMAKSKCHEPKESTKASRAFGDIRDQVPVICSEFIDLLPSAVAD